MEGHIMDARARRFMGTALATSAAVLLLAGAARAQAPVVVDPQSAPAAQSTKPESPAAATAAQPPAPEEVPHEPVISAVLAGMRIRGYADVGFGKPLQENVPDGGLQNSKSSFQIADLHLFVTSKLSDEWSFLSELLITSNFSNEFTPEMDRLLIQYNPNKYLRVGFGKFNTGLGYYTNQFHRAKFYQTATGRPVMFTDDDNSGILPVHQVGVTVQGEIPSGSFGLHYIGEIGNGRDFIGKGNDQNFVDLNNGKAVNLGLFVRPDAAPALDVGFTVYRDTLEPAALPKVRETITAAHAVWLTPDVEFLNEMALVRHAAEANGSTATTKSFYTQVSRRFDVVRPYFRYEYQDVPSTDPIFGLADVIMKLGIRKAISGGVRFDVRQFAVVKFQFDHALQDGVWANGAHAQLAFAF